MQKLLSDYIGEGMIKKRKQYNQHSTNDEPFNTAPRALPETICYRSMYYVLLLSSRKYYFLIALGIDGRQDEFVISSFFSQCFRWKFFGYSRTEQNMNQTLVDIVIVFKLLARVEKLLPDIFSLVKKIFCISRS